MKESRRSTLVPSTLGNLMGPVVTNLITADGWGNIVRLPHGCGEQTIITMAPNVYALWYLQSTNQVTDVIERNAYKYIQYGMKRS